MNRQLSVTLKKEPQNLTSIFSNIATMSAFEKLQLNHLVAKIN